VHPSPHPLEPALELEPPLPVALSQAPFSPMHSRLGPRPHLDRHSSLGVFLMKAIPQTFNPELLTFNPKP